MNSRGKARFVGAATAVGVIALTANLSGQEPSSDVDSLRRENQQLRKELKALREEFERKIKTLEADIDQSVKGVGRKRELEDEAANTEGEEALKKSEKSRFAVPDWITNVRLINDLRLRYDGIYAPDSDFVTRHRFRPRLRLGGIATLKDDFEIGFRIASAPSIGKDSGGDPLSTNLTFEDNGSRKALGVDWAFARWTPLHTPDWTASFTIGKMENPPNFTEDVFDVDYTPEGVVEQFSFKLNPNHTITSYFGQYMLDELQFSTKDPFLFLEQLRLESKWDKNISTAFTLSGLQITNPENLSTANVPDSNHGNTRDAAGVLQKEYRLLIADGRFIYSLDGFPLYNGAFPISLNGE